MYKKLAVVIIGITILMIPAAASFAEEGDGHSTIEVTGRAKIMAMPDAAFLSLAVESTADQAQDAVRKNAVLAERVLKVLKKLSEKSDEIKTSAYSLSPVYEKGNRASPSGYRVRNTIILKTNNLDKVGAFIDEAAKAGANRLGSLTFSSDREEALRKDAAAEAVRQAIKSAENLAGAADLKVKRIISISYAPKWRIPSPMLMADMGSPSTPVEAGQISIEATVNVVFEVN